MIMMMILMMKSVMHIKYPSYFVSDLVLAVRTYVSLQCVFTGLQCKLFLTQPPKNQQIMMISINHDGDKDCDVMMMLIK